jgi:hypothetical protein
MVGFIFDSKYRADTENQEKQIERESAAKFSTKDVMELTLLHAQQMKLLSTAYE